MAHVYRKRKQYDFIKCALIQVCCLATTRNAESSSTGSTIEFVNIFIDNNQFSSFLCGSSYSFLIVLSF